MLVNQAGDPINEEIVSFSDLTLEERKQAVDLLFQHLGLEIIRTNATKHGNTMLELRSNT